MYSCSVLRANRRLWWRRWCVLFALRVFPMVLAFGVVVLAPCGCVCVYGCVCCSDSVVVSLCDGLVVTRQKSQQNQFGGLCLPCLLVCFGWMPCSCARPPLCPLVAVPDRDSSTNQQKSAESDRDVCLLVCLSVHDGRTDGQNDCLKATRRDVTWRLKTLCSDETLTKNSIPIIFIRVLYRRILGRDLSSQTTKGRPNQIKSNQINQTKSNQQ